MRSKWAAYKNQWKWRYTLNCVRERKKKWWQEEVKCDTLAGMRKRTIAWNHLKEATCKIKLDMDVCFREKARQRQRQQKTFPSFRMQNRSHWIGILCCLMLVIDNEIVKIANMENLVFFFRFFLFSVVENSIMTSFQRIFMILWKRAMGEMVEALFLLANKSTIYSSKALFTMHSVLSWVHKLDTLTVPYRRITCLIYGVRRDGGRRYCNHML